ncbi:MAG: neutral/alkaline non-lysosomal ceramidase N-terminal domain-containing protein [Acidobacteriota bacterium]
MDHLNRRTFLQAMGLTALAAPLARANDAPASWRAGVASLDITPQRSLWMAGFALRKQPSQGTALPLHAKALALQAGRGPVAVLVTVDLLGLTAGITDRVAAAVRRRHGIARSALLFNASHTHCGPVVDEQLSVAYDLSAEQWDALREYTAQLERHLIAVIGDAVSRLAPASLASAQGRAYFAANRRVAFSPDGPVDHAVPILKVDGDAGAPLAIVFGYACHNTTLQDGFVQYHGDYAGVAQAALQRRHPGATALFVMGCGADANPKPRGTIALVEAHGTALADAVDAALPGASPIAPALHTAYGTVELPFVDAAARERWHARLDIDPIYLRRHAALMAGIVRRDGRLPSFQRDPLQVWRFGGRDLTLVALGGEVVVDYAVRLAREHPGQRIWTAGYSNDVFGYVPSRRVLDEGGYEGGDAMIYYGRPGPFTDVVEDRIIAGVNRLMAG